MNSGIKFINWNKNNNKWVVSATIDGTRRYLGSFDNLEDAKIELIKNGLPILKKNGNSKHRINDTYFYKIDSPEKAFWFGFICADGSIYKVGDSLALKICQNNDILLNKFIKDIDSDVKIYKENNRNLFCFTTYNRNIVKDLLNNGKTRYKKDLNCIPKSVTDKLKKYFIRGYFEGDGSISFNNSNNNMMFQLSGYKGIVNDIADYLSKGINKSIGVYKDNSIYAIRVTGNNKVKLIMNYLYDDINDINNYPKLIKYNKLIGR